MAKKIKNYSGRPIYTPKQLMNEGQQAGAGQFMMMQFLQGIKPNQSDQLRGGNWRNNPAVQFIEKIITKEDGSTSTIKVPVESKIQDPYKVFRPENFNKFEFTEYQGPYHSYPNGAVMTGASFSEDSVPLIPYSSAIEMAERVDHVLAQKKKPIDREGAQAISQQDNADQPVRSPNNSIYFKLTGTRFDLYLNPKYYYPVPTESNYEEGFLYRYFVQKINDTSSIMEINKDDYDSANTDNRQGVDKGIYNIIEMQWTIAGPIADARKANDRVIIFANTNMPGIGSYLTDLDEFHKLAGTINADVEIGLYTPGREFLLPDGQEYIGQYHVHPDKGPMVGSEHVLESHERLIRIRDSEAQQGTGGGGGIY